jgi:hypothetical protein
MVLLSFPRPVRFLELRVPEEAKNLAGKVLRLIQDPLATGSFPKILATCQNNSPRALNRRFKFDKRSQLFIGTHNAVIRVYYDAGNVIETHEHKREFKGHLQVS